MALQNLRQPFVVPGERLLNRMDYDVSMNWVKSDFYLCSSPEHIMFFGVIPLAFGGYNNRVTILALVVTIAIAWRKYHKASNNFARTAAVREFAADPSFAEWIERRNCLARCCVLSSKTMVSAFLYYKGISSVNAIAEIDHTWFEASKRRFARLMDTQGMGVLSGLPASTIMLVLVIGAHFLQIAVTVWALEKMESARDSMNRESADARSPEFYRFYENKMWQIRPLILALGRITDWLKREPKPIVIP